MWRGMVENSFCTRLAHEAESKQRRVVVVRGDLLCSASLYLRGSAYFGFVSCGGLDGG